MLFQGKADAVVAVAGQHPGNQGVHRRDPFRRGRWRDDRRSGADEAAGLVPGHGHIAAGVTDAAEQFGGDDALAGWQPPDRVEERFYLEKTGEAALVAHQHAGRFGRHPGRGLGLLGKG